LAITIKGGIKFRTLEKEEKIRTTILQDNQKTPSHVTIRNWTLKVGFYQLDKVKTKSTDWIIMLDHSIQFGQDKIFVVFGIRETDFLMLNRPLQYTDLVPLLIKPAKKWTGELVAKEIAKLKKKIGNIKYSIADYGGDLRKGLRLSELIHLHDLSHLISLIIEKIYATDSRYILFKNKMSEMRNKFIQTNIAAIVPPKGRNKSQYQNFNKIIKWGNESLNLINNKLNDKTQIKKLKENKININEQKRIKTELSWINEFVDLIAELTEINQVVQSIEKKIKHNGLTKENVKESEQKLQGLKSNNGKKFAESLISELNVQNKLLPEVEKLLFSSDILESTFGKYKNRTSENPMASITSLMLIIAAFTCELTEEKVKEIMEKIKISDIKKWEKKQIGTTLFKKRSVLLSDK